MKHAEVETTLPSLDETLDRLAAVEERYPEGVRVEQTRKALEANESFARDRRRLDAYFAHLASKDMFLEMYGLGHAPNGLPMALPSYLMEILVATSKVLCALGRRNLRAGGPRYLVDRMPEGWVTEEMAERLYAHFLTHEPDMGFDTLVYGRGSHRGMTFEEFKKTDDLLQAKILEAQSVDTYPGWVREYIRASRAAGLGEGCQFTWSLDERGRPLSDEDLDRQVAASLNHGGGPEAVMFLEVDPERQATYQNLCFMADLMSGEATDPRRRPVILDPRDVEFRGEGLFVTRPGLEREVRKVVSRLVDSDLKAYVKAREAEGRHDVVERLRRIFQTPALFPDLSKHLCGFYLIDKSSLTDMSLLGSVGIAPRTELVTPEVLERYRRDASLLHGIAIKPLHGQSAKGVTVGPTLAQVEEAVAREPMLAQETFWATPLQPSITPDIDDPDVQAGICCEARLVLQAGSPAVRHDPHGARVIAGLARSHFQSKDPERKVKGDAKGRGWYSNIGAIMAVKVELGTSLRDDVGIGMAPIYSPV